MRIKRQSKGKLKYSAMKVNREYDATYILEMRLESLQREQRRYYKCWKGTLFKARIKTKKTCRFFGSNAYQFNFAHRSKLQRNKNWLRV